MRRAGRLLVGALLSISIAACSDLGEELDLGPPVEQPPDPPDPPDGPALPDTLSIVASRDNTLYEHPSGLLSNGAGAYVFAGKSAGSQVRRALLRFELPAPARAGSVVQAAWIDLECSRTRNLDPASVSLHRVSASWGEAASDAIAEEGPGAAAVAGDATWIHRQFDTVAWVAVGGDFEAAGSATVAVLGPDAYRWASTEQLVADVQGWVDDPASNHGWLLHGDEAVVESAKRFNSREHAVEATRPRLTVVLAPAVP